MSLTVSSLLLNELESIVGQEFNKKPASICHQEGEVPKHFYIFLLCPFCYLYLENITCYLLPGQAISNLVHTSKFSGEGNGNPLQYSCLENPMDKQAWWATVHSIKKSWKWLKQLSMQAEIIAIDTSLLYLSSNIHDLNCCSPICPWGSMYLFIYFSLFLQTG